MIVGTYNGVTTDMAGRYEIAVKKGQELEFSYYGYIPEKTMITRDTMLEVRLKSDSAEIWMNDKSHHFY